MSNFFRSRHAPPTPLISHHSFSQYLPPSWQGHLSIFFNLFHFLFILQKHKQTHTHTHTRVCARAHTHTHTHKHACAHSSLTLSHRYPTPHHHLYHLFPVKFTAKIHRKMLRLIHIYYLR